MKNLLPFDLRILRKYFSEKNALTVATSAFCLLMMGYGIIKEDIWLAVGFALAFSFSIEVICHRTHKNN